MLRDFSNLLTSSWSVEDDGWEKVLHLLKLNIQDNGLQFETSAVVEIDNLLNKVSKSGSSVCWCVFDGNQTYFMDSVVRKGIPLTNITSATSVTILCIVIISFGIVTKFL